MNPYVRKIQHTQFEIINREICCSLHCLKIQMSKAISVSSRRPMSEMSIELFECQVHMYIHAQTTIICATFLQFCVCYVDVN